MNARTWYNMGYRLARMPWEMGPRQELVELVSGGRLLPCRALDLGCGTGANAIYLARHGFDVTGVDFAPAALAKARRAAAAAGVAVRFVEDDLTGLRNRYGEFDLLVDYGTLDDLSQDNRARYVANVLPLTRAGTRFLLWAFEWPPRWFERRIGLGPMAPGEVVRRFGGEFAIERIAGTETPGRWRMIPGVAAYLMTRTAG
ncbi:class I SAM-dependent methyltransferase [Acrocarpospora phusangensis]|nr:class I SAM-dependent methyltransferase [Acrocarpospora phusangensis]